MAGLSHDVRVFLADLADARHCEGLLEVLDSYAQDPVGGGQPLPERTRRELIPALKRTPQAVILLAENRNGITGIAVCFLGLSTFSARPLLNIHDLAVMPASRGEGVGRALLQAAEDEAVRRGCCKLTLEVQDRNTVARGLYQSFGFRDFELGEPVVTRFLSKTLASADA